MTDRSPFEDRIATLIAAYADRAPIDVDPMAVTRLAAAAAARRGWPWTDFGRADRGLAILLLVVALLASLFAGALLAAGVPFRRGPDEILLQRGFIEPFSGLPPEGATPSTPETGELVLGFNGRTHAIGLKFHRVWVYADGRLIWIREGSTTPGVLEQRLRPDGVELMRLRAITAGLRDSVPDGTSTSPRHGPGVLWGSLVVRDGDRLVEVAWSDPGLPAALADPESWLPAGAWEDERIGAYVPSVQAICLEPAQVMDALPDATRELLRSRARGVPVAAWESEELRCPIRVTTDDARAIMATLDDAGLQAVPFLRYHIPNGPPAPLSPGWVEILPVLPHGEVVCDCG